MTEIRSALEAALEGGPERHRKKVAEQEKLPVRDRVERLLDAGSLSEDALLANWEQEGLGRRRRRDRDGDDRRAARSR